LYRPAGHIPVKKLIRINNCKTNYMANPFVAEIRIFPFNFAPIGWAMCNGQLLAISQNTALFSLLGTTYGGNGQSNFALPDLQGNAAMHPGQGQGLSLRDLGQIGGRVTVTLISSEMPLHTHTVNSRLAGGKADPLNNAFGTAGTQLPPPNFYATATGTAVMMSPQALTQSGGDLPHNNLMPYLTLNFCIALQGVFPSRN
jgi:microcystin-dependent protein